jgi:hypothetical protein
MEGNACSSISVDEISAKVQLDYSIKARKFDFGFVPFRRIAKESSMQILQLNLAQTTPPLSQLLSKFLSRFKFL